MTQVAAVDLGCGVRVSRASDGEIVVTSPKLRLGWRTAAGKIPGTAVTFEGVPHEVIGRAELSSGDQWYLRPWREPSAMRVVVELDRDYVQCAGEMARSEARGRTMGRFARPLLPILGLAPAALQRRWAARWNFEAERATRWSAVMEMAWGGLGLLQLLTAMLGGEAFMPMVLAYPGPLMLVSGCVRLALVAADDEPVGSPLGLPLLLVTRSQPAARESTSPTVQQFDADRGVLELTSPLMRRDWEHGGVLFYRGMAFRLCRSDRQGPQWVYGFERVAEADPETAPLRLAPAPDAPYVPRHLSSETPPLLATVLVSAAVTLGPRSDQEAWARHLNLSPRWLTLLGAGAELVGGLVNLGSDADVPVLVVLDLLLIGEGLLRLGSALGGRAMGSVFGWVLRPLYRRWIPPSRAHGHHG